MKTGRVTPLAPEFRREKLDLMHEVAEMVENRFIAEGLAVPSE